MKQENPENHSRAAESLAKLKQVRGKVGDFHRRIANDPDLLDAFSETYRICNKGVTNLPPKYKDMIIFAIGCAQGNAACINNHSLLAVQNGATVEELGDVLKLVFLMCGSTGIMNAAEIFEPLDI